MVLKSNQLVKKSDPAFLFAFLTILTGIITLLPFLYFQSEFAQGDHGVNLYVSQAILNGQKPYRDVHWWYGPLMPYYYAGIFKIFGVSIKSAFLGQYFLLILTGLFFYFTLTTIFPLNLSFLGASWFFAVIRINLPNYNHVGGFALMLGVIYTLFLYLKNNKNIYLYFSLIFIFLLHFIKINYGLCILFCFVTGLFFIDWLNKTNINSEKKKIYFFSIIILPALAGCVYYYFLHDVPLYEIRQCLPYFGNDEPNHSPIHRSILKLIHYKFHDIKANNIYLIISGWLLFSILFIFKFFKSKKNSPREKRILLEIGTILLGFYILNLHEFLRSGFFYRAYWAEPLLILGVFILAAFPLKDAKKWTQYLFISAAGILLIFYYDARYKEPEFTIDAKHYLSLKKGEVFLGNSPQWIQTVTQTTEFLNTHLTKDESFLALPYDALYYFLTGKPSPTRLLIFFIHNKIRPVQEKKIIEQMKNDKINWIVLSNRSYSSNKTLGIFGKTHCLFLNDYIQTHFKTIAQLGQWDKEAQWIENHGIKILKRIN